MSSVMTTNEEQLTELAQEIQCGNSDEVQRLLHEVFAAHESDLFNGMGQLTRKLHDSLRSFDFDSRLADIAENELSDARARLDYVVAKTEESAHRTLDVLEESAPISKQALSNANDRRTKSVPDRHGKRYWSDAPSAACAPWSAYCWPVSWLLAFWLFLLSTRAA